MEVAFCYFTRKLSRLDVSSRSRDYDHKNDDVRDELAEKCQLHSLICQKIGRRKVQT